MLLELATVWNLYTQSPLAQAQESAPVTASSGTASGDNSAATSSAALKSKSESESESAAASTSENTNRNSGGAIKKSSKKKHRRRKKRVGALNPKLPPFEGVKAEASALAPQKEGADSNSGNNAGLGAAAPANTPGKGEVSDQDLASGPVIKNGKVTSTAIGSEEGSTELDPLDRSFLRFGIHAGENLTRYKHFNSSAQENALLIGAQMGVATDLWDGLRMFGAPLSGEENVRLDYSKSPQPGVAQMVQMRLESVLFFGPDTDSAHGLIPLVGLGLGYATAEIRNTNADQSVTQTQVKAAILTPEFGVRWRIADRLAADLKLEPLVASDARLYNFGYLDAQLGLLLLF